MSSNNAYGAPTNNATINSFGTNDPAWTAAVDIVTKIEKGITMEGASHPIVNQTNVKGANAPTTFDLTANDTTVSIATWKKLDQRQFFLNQDAEHRE
jgi:hypothetical protein